MLYHLYLCILFLTNVLAQATLDPSGRNLGPLTTAFEPPETCFFTTFLLNSASDVIQVVGYAGGYIMRATLASFISDLAASCYPTGYEPRYDGNYQDYYSPGLICPSGFSLGARSDLYTVDGETRGLCCLTGWTVFTTGSVLCRQVFTAPATASAVLFSSGNVSGEFNVLRSTSIEGAQAPLSVTLQALFGSGIHVRWHEADLEGKAGPGASATGSVNESESGVSSGSSPLSTSSQSEETSASPASSTSSIGGKGDNEKQHSGLSQGAKIGIGVGIPLILLTIIFVVFAFLLRRRAKRRRRHGSSTYAHEQFNGVPVEKYESEGEPPRVYQSPVAPAESASLQPRIPAGEHQSAQNRLESPLVEQGASGLSNTLNSSETAESARPHDIHETAERLGPSSQHEPMAGDAERSTQQEYTATAPLNSRHRQEHVAADTTTAVHELAADPVPISRTERRAAEPLISLPQHENTAPVVLEHTAVPGLERPEHTTTTGATSARQPQESPGAEVLPPPHEHNATEIQGSTSSAESSAPPTSFSHAAATAAPENGIISPSAQLPKDEELAWLESEEERIRERRRIIQYLTRLKEEDHKLATDEAAIRERIRLKRG